MTAATPIQPTVRFGPRPEIWYLALCHDCTPVLPMPFSTPDTRATWVASHMTATGHTVTLRDEPR